MMGLKPEREFRFHSARRWRFDFAFPAERIGVEVDGALGSGKHSRREGQLNDMDKRNAATALGWRVLVYSDKQIKSGAASAQIQELFVGVRCLPELAVVSDELLNEN